MLEMLNLLEPLELHRKPFLGADSVHLMVQAKQLAYHDRDRHLADPRFADVPMERLISKKYADERRALMDPAHALPWDRIPSYGSLTGDTVYIAAVDRQGNAASLVHSVYGVFGAAVVAGRTGVVLQNRAAYFSLDPSSPNRVEPGKTPLHTLIASLGFRNDRLWSVLGCMGADGQPQIHMQAYSAMIDHGLDIQQALDMPRFLSGRFGLLEARDTLHIEGRFPAETITELARRGHILDRWGDWNEVAGHANGITIDPVTGQLAGGADPRSDGEAVGFSWTALSRDRHWSRAQTTREALVAVLHHGLAAFDVGREAADIRHEHARLAGDVGADIPRAAGRAQRAAGRLADMADPGLLGLAAGLDQGGAARAHVFDALGDPFDVLLDRRQHVGQHRRAARTGDGEEVGEARHGEAKIGFRPLLPLVLQRSAIAAANVDPEQRAGHGVEAGGQHQAVEAVILALRAQARRP